MISAWKKFINKSDSSYDATGPNGTNGVPPGIQKIDKGLQRKFARGINYNMKVVIKGDARVGKTCLFQRLRGHGFDDNCAPTENLTVTSIDWSYKATDDVVKIDLWEAIDISSRKTNTYVDLKTENKVDQSATETPLNSTPQPGQPAESKPSNQNSTHANNLLSMNGGRIGPNPIPEAAQKSLAELSENFDVYTNTDAVLLVLDMTKQWTFKYVQAELIKIPRHIPVLVIANHRDQGHHRTVSAKQVKALLDGLDRTPVDGIVMYTEASMKNGFGLKLIEKFFNVPFLKLQEASLLKQLELNRCEFLATREELQALQESTNREYEQYIELQTLLRRQQADAMSPVNSGLRQLDEATREKIRNTTMSSDMLDKNQGNARSIESNPNLEKQSSSAQLMASQNFVNDRLPSIVIGAKCPLPETTAFQKGLTNPSQPETKATSATENQSSNDGANEPNEEDSDEEDEIPRANPLVADYQSDLDSDDQMSSKTATVPATAT